MIGMMLGLPGWAKAAIAGAVLLGALQARHLWQVRGLEKEIAALSQALDREQAATADLRVGLSDVMANRDQLAARIREQNRALELLQARAKEADARAAVSAARALEAGRQASAALLAPTTTVPPGHAAMNAWVQEQFAR